MSGVWVSGDCKHGTKLVWRPCGWGSDAQTERGGGAVWKTTFVAPPTSQVQAVSLMVHLGSYKQRTTTRETIKKRSSTSTGRRVSQFFSFKPTNSTHKICFAINSHITHPGYSAQKILLLIKTVTLVPWRSRLGVRQTVNEAKHQLRSSLDKASAKTTLFIWLKKETASYQPLIWISQRR